MNFVKNFLATWIITLGSASAAIAEPNQEEGPTQRVHDIISEVGWSCRLTEIGTDDVFGNYSMVATLDTIKNDTLTILYKIDFDERDLTYKAIHRRWKWVYDDIGYTIETRINSNLSEEEVADVLKRFNPLAELKSMSDGEMTQSCLPMS